MDEIGSPGFLIAGNISHRFFINYIKLHWFSSKETKFHALHLLEIGSPCVPVSDVCFVLVLSLMKAVCMNSTSRNTLSRNFCGWNSTRLISNRFSWFPRFSLHSKQYLWDGFWIDRTVFPGKLIHKLFTFLHELAINRSCFQGRSISGKAFVTIFERVCHWILIDGVDFHSYIMNEINFNGLSINEIQFRDFPLKDVYFHGVPSMKSLSLVLQSTLLVFMGFTLRIRCLHGLSSA